MPLEHLKQQNNHKRRSAPLCSPAMITSIIPPLIDDWYPPSTLISSFMMYDLWKFWSDWLQPPPRWSVHLSQGRRSSSVTSKITCRAAVDHSPTSISDIRAVFHLWATYVILNIAKGKVALSQDSCCVYYFFGLWPTGGGRTVAYENSAPLFGSVWRGRGKGGLKWRGKQCVGL